MRVTAAAASVGVIVALGWLGCDVGGTCSELAELEETGVPLAPPGPMAADAVASFQLDDRRDRYALVSVFTTHDPAVSDHRQFDGGLPTGSDGGTGILSAAVTGERQITVTAREAGRGFVVADATANCYPSPGAKTTFLARSVTPIDAVVPDRITATARCADGTEPTFVTPGIEVIVSYQLWSGETRLHGAPNGHLLEVDGAGVGAGALSTVVTAPPTPQTWEVRSALDGQTVLALEVIGAGELDVSGITPAQVEVPELPRRRRVSLTTMARGAPSCGELQPGAVMVTTQTPEVCKLVDDLHPNTGAFTQKDSITLESAVFDIFATRLGTCQLRATVPALGSDIQLEVEVIREGAGCSSTGAGPALLALTLLLACALASSGARRQRSPIRPRTS